MVAGGVKNSSKNIAKKIQPYCNQRLMIILLMGISSGLPLALTGSTLQVWYTDAGLSLLTIGALSLVGYPYILKFIWAPLLDRFVPLSFGRRRSWIFVLQGALAVSLAMMALMKPSVHPGLLALVALAVAFFSASQDASIDAYRTDLLPVSERGMGATMIIFGYRLALVVSGALALIMSAEWGWRLTYFIMAGIMVLGMVVTWVSPNPVDEQAPRNLHDAVVKPFVEFIQRRHAWWLLVFVIIYKLCDALALSLNSTFLLRGVGFDLIDIGSIAKTTGLAATLLGTLLGGVLLPRLGLYWSLFIFGFLQMLSNLLFALLAVVGKSYSLLVISMFSDYFSGGLSTVAFVVLITSLCDHRYTATQYALLSAFASVGRVIVGPIAAVMVNSMGWAEFYVWSFVIGLPSLGLLWWLNREMNFGAVVLGEPSE